MKKCPNCAVEMEHSRYEGFGVEKCPQCEGHFVRKSSMEGIKRKRDVPSEDLVQQAQKSESSNTVTDISCPGCYSMMDKERTMGYPKVEYDSCPHCQGIWLDPGELEMVQLVYEASMKGEAEYEMRENFDEFMTSKERQTRFKGNLAKCKDPSYTLWGSIKGGIAESFVEAFTRGRRGW